MFLNELDSRFLESKTAYECLPFFSRTDALQWLKTIDGFSNSSGGILFIGVEDKTNRFIGFSLEEVNREIEYFL